VVVKYRINDELVNKIKLPEKAKGLVEKIKEIFSRSNNGEYYFKANFKNIKYLFYGSILETIHGEKIVLRIKKEKIELIDLEKIGLMENDLTKIIRILQKKKGLIVICGEKNSGKTTLAYSLLDVIESPRLNINTLEKNIEYNIKNINQTELNRKKSLARVEMLKIFKNQDIDVAFIDEFENSQELNSLLELSLDKLIITIIEADNISDALTKILSLGADQYLLKNNLKIIIGQKMYNKICPKCKEEKNITQEIIDLLKTEKEIEEQEINKILNKKIYISRGCSACQYSGHQDKIIFFEVLELNKKILNDFIENENIDILEAMDTNIEEQALIEAFNGKIDFEDFIKS
jgi:type II secretory ATPase GspE/PulE/Tfp pilus assembly ATPase PilB-like protein